MNEQLLQEFKNKLGRGVSQVISNTPAPIKGSDAELYYIRMMEIVDYLKMQGIKIAEVK